MKQSSSPTSLALIFFGMLCAPLFSQTFNLGSNGSYGPLVVPANQSVVLQVPPDGVFHCTTITIENGQSTSLTFIKNAANTPVYLLATGDVYLGSKATASPPLISVGASNPSGSIGGEGGPGGFNGGHGGPSPGDGHGPGGGKGGWTSTAIGGKPAGLVLRGSASFSSRSVDAGQVDSAGSIYGNALLLPLIGGSGGGGGQGSSHTNSYGGGGGGGAILIASNTKITAAPGGMCFIHSKGSYAGIASDYFGNGSGGAVRLVAPVIEGNITLNLWPGNFNHVNAGGFGRGRIDRLNSGGLSVTNDGVGGVITYGSNMTVFPPNMPSLRITQVGTQVVPAEQATPVYVLFPTGSSPSQTVSVSVKDFFTNVPLRAVVTPESGSRQTFDFTVDNTAGGTTTGSAQVQIPAGVSSRVDVWTR